jgi:adenylyltransferase/sulfurtransferase
VDRDFLEWNNLQRQVLYDEADVQADLPKSIAAARKLRDINSDITIEPIVADVSSRNIEQLLEGVDVIADGTDNFETRFLLNDASFHYRIPWVYGGCIGSEGQTMTVIPGETPCLRCLIPEPPLPGSTPTCDTAGILGPTVNIVASLQSAEVLKLASGNRGAISRVLTVIDLWDNQMRQVKLEALQDNTECPTCTGREYPWLQGARGSQTTVLCGRNAVQLSFPDRPPVSLETLESKLSVLGAVVRNPFLLRFTTHQYTITVFPDGRAVIGGTDDPAEAKSLYARYVGS